MNGWCCKGHEAQWRAYARAVALAFWYALDMPEHPTTRRDPSARNRHLGRLYRRVRGVKV